MGSKLRRSIATLLVWVMTLTGGVAAIASCRHGDAAPVSGAPVSHAGHAMHDAGGDADTGKSIGAGCDCGCACAGSCNHVCQSSSMLTQASVSPLRTDAERVAADPGVLTNFRHHPPLKPPIA